MDHHDEYDETIESEDSLEDDAYDEQVDHAEKPEAVIRLPRTLLSVVGDSLIKEASDGTAIGRHKLSGIQDVSILKKLSPGAIIMVIIFTGVAAVAKRMLEAPLWSWIIFLVFALIALFTVFLIYKYQLKIIIRDEELIYDITDTVDDLSSFTLSLKEILREKKEELRHH
ncbi:MAG: hypothetical protein GY765_15470 [bacterium]|nr:hypothetical protein [bacterium]